MTTPKWPPTKEFVRALQDDLDVAIKNNAQLQFAVRNLQAQRDKFKTELAEARERARFFQEKLERLEAMMPRVVR